MLVEKIHEASQKAVAVAVVKDGGKGDLVLPVQL